MTPLPRLLAATCTAALVVPLLLAGPASADTETKRDPRGDVSEIRGRGMPEVRRNVDVLQLTSTHADGVVSMRVVVDDLDRSTPVGGSFGVATSDGKRFLAVVQRDEAGQRSTFLVDAGTGQPVACRSLRAAFLPAADRITMSVPRACVRRPRWVRTGAVASSVVEPFVLTFGDDARRDGEVRSPVPFIGTKRLFHN